MRDVVRADGQVTLLSCSTGEYRDRVANLANTMAQVWPHATIHAADRPTNATPSYDFAGRYTGMAYYRFDEGDADTHYEIRPAASVVAEARERQRQRGDAR